MKRVRILLGLLAVALGGTWSIAGAQTQENDRCPVLVTIGPHGTLYDGKLRVRRTTLATYLHNGCKEAGPVSSVKIQPDPAVQYRRVLEIMDLVRSSVRPGTPITLVDPKLQQP